MKESENFSSACSKRSLPCSLTQTLVVVGLRPTLRVGFSIISLLGLLSGSVVVVVVTKKRKRGQKCPLERKTKSLEREVGTHKHTLDWPESTGCKFACLCVAFGVCSTFVRRSECKIKTQRQFEDSLLLLFQV